MKFDSSVKNVITAAYQSERDVFLKVEMPDLKELSFDTVKTVVFIPGAFYGDDSFFFSDIRKSPSDYHGLLSPDILFCDIRFLAEESFRQYLTDNLYRRFMVIFAECADKTEYGYRQSYGWIGEYKAEISHFCQTVAFFTAMSDSMELCNALFSCNRPVFIGNDADSEINCFETASPREKFFYTAINAEKYAYHRVCIYFNSRGEAVDFYAYMNNRGTACVYIDGSKPFAERKDSILGFSESEPNILIATKAYIPTSLFYPPEKVIFCGVPFSESHYCRCKTSADIFLIYCEEDFRRNEKIIKSFSHCLEDEGILHNRLKRLNDMKKILKSSQ